MKTAISKNKVQRMGVQSEGNFRIKATGKAFRILSDGLYSDKITAIIRELSCNAYDAHVEAGNLDKPFSLHLPTQFEPHFSLRDFGVGLSHDDVIHVYTTYFESTKTDSNDFIGCLGLGSKSPFSYVDNFSIVSYHKGEKRTYNAFMNEDGIPSIALMATEKSKEHNGIEVSFAVSNNDFRSFYSRIPNVFRYFKLHPEITGHKDIKIESVQYGLKGNGWGIRKGDEYGHARAIMGNIAYPLDDMDSDKVTKDEWSLITSKVDIQFEIGELEVAASRENISFNKATIQNVQRRLAKLVQEVSKKVQTELNACPTLWDARILAVELSNSKYSGLRSIFNVGNIKYKGKEVEGGLGNTIVAIPKDLQDELDIAVFAPRNRRRRANRYSPYNSDDKIVTMSKDPQGISVNSNGFRFFHKDIDRGAHIRSKQVVQISLNTDDEVQTVYLLENKVAGAIQRLMDLLGYEGKIQDISTVERPKRASRGISYNPMNSKRMLVYEMDDTDHDENDKSSYWRTDKVDVRHGGIYVPISRYKVRGEYLPDRYIGQYIRGLEAVGEDTDIQIVGVKTALQDKVENDPDWISLEEYVKGKVAEYIEANDLHQHFVKSVAYSNANDASGDISFILSKYEEWDVADDSPITKYVELLAGWKESVDVASKFHTMASRLGIDWQDKDAEKEIEAMEKEHKALLADIQATYPMLKMIDSYNYEAKIVKDYVALMDSQNKS